MLSLVDGTVRTPCLDRLSVAKGKHSTVTANVAVRVTI
jgi:hypothetical protein